jgi:WhiB family redox-sensing transcriptional regulator
MAHFDEGICTPDQIDVFFPDSEASGSDPAKAICRECPARYECLDYALKENMGGIWGGTTTEERRKLRRRRLRPGAA